VHAGRRLAKSAEIVFMFPGQGAQYPDMGKDLFERYPEFRQHIEQCSEILEPLMAQNLLNLLYRRSIRRKRNSS